ncbi:MAG: glycosyltransferase family protein [Bacteroidota bacterium]
MKILYAVQATGNGHISRAIELMPYLKKYGETDVFLSGSNATLECSLPVKFRSRGLSLFYSKCGGLDYKKTWINNSVIRAKKEALQLPVEQYDLIINDFEYITAQACSIKNIPSVQFGHQASFMSANTPRPQQRNLFGEMVLKHYAPATQYIGLHFQPYAEFIFPPVIKTCFRNSEPTNKGHITVYLPAYLQSCIEQHFRSIPHIHFHWFLDGIKELQRIGNISFYPVDNHLFNNSLMHCEGIITGGGFETPAEALYLGKKLLSIPIRAQYEQQCNGAALKKLGITVIRDADTAHFADDITQWLNEVKTGVKQEANNVTETLSYLVDTYPDKKEVHSISQGLFA